MHRRGLVLALAGLCATAAPAFAHHSFQMFDLNKVQTVSGAVKEYRFRMPHTWIYMELPTGPGGALQEWGFECHAPNLIARKGWSVNTLKAGDKITVVMHPMRDGSRAGSVVNIVLADGRTLWNAEAIDKP